MDKAKLLENLREKVDAELASLVRAAKAAHEAATHDESRPEDQYDTRGLEASYLAGAQASRAGELQQLQETLRSMAPREFKPGDVITISALIEVNVEDARSWFLIVPGGGGFQITQEGVKVQVITPRSPLGDELMGRRAGDIFEVELRGDEREYEILRVL